MWRVLLISIAALACVLCLSRPVYAEKRVALVIGIDTYDNLPADQQLLKARNDAKAMQATLGALGFDVIDGLDLSRSEFNLKLSEFQQKLQPGDVATVFYAGHGIEIDGRNYLLPRDIPAVVIGQEDFLTREAIELNSIMETLQKAGTRINLIILDACRDNPFADPAGRGVGGTRGLSRIVPPTGTFVMYSAGAHQKALDRLNDGDQDENSVYTRSLIPLLSQPGRSIQVIAKEVQVKVKALAESVRRTQHPAYYDQIIGDFYLVKATGDQLVTKPEAQAAPPPSPTIPPTPDAPDRKEEAEKLRGEMAYLECVGKNELNCYKSFLADFPDHPRAEQVKKLMRFQIEIPRYQTCESAKTYGETLRECNLYLHSFPNGQYRDAANRKLKRAQEEHDRTNEEQDIASGGRDHHGTPPAPPPSPPIPAPSARSFTTYSGYDLYGGDYSQLAGKVSYNDCLSACRNDGRCKAFTYNTQARACFLKSLVPTLSPFNNAISGVLANLSPPRQPAAGACGSGFTTYNNTDFFGNDIAGYNAGLERCRQLCLANSGCRGYSWINKQVKKRCWLKHALSPPSTNSTVISCARN